MQGGSLIDYENETFNGIPLSVIQSEAIKRRVPEIPDFYNAIKFLERAVKANPDKANELIEKIKERFGLNAEKGKAQGFMSVANTLNISDELQDGLKEAQNYEDFIKAAKAAIEFQISNFCQTAAISENPADWQKLSQGAFDWKAKQQSQPPQSQSQKSLPQKSQPQQSEPPGPHHEARKRKRDRVRDTFKAKKQRMNDRIDRIKAGRQKKHKERDPDATVQSVPSTSTVVSMLPLTQQLHEKPETRTFLPLNSSKRQSTPSSEPGLRAISFSDSQGSRLITTFQELPFYQSSGKNSKHPGTWFPFKGMYTDKFIYGPGDFVKPYVKFGGGSESLSRQNFVNENDTLNKKLDDLIGKNAADDLRDRFGTIPCMLISSQFGGGLWDTKEGKELKSYLQETYREFYEKYPEVSIGKSQQDIKESDLGQPKAAEQVNAWLKMEGVKDLVTNGRELGQEKKILPLTVDEIGTKATAKSIHGPR